MDRGSILWNGRCLAITGGLTGGLTGSLDAMMSGADHTVLVAAYVASIGVIAGGCVGWLLGIALAGENRWESDLPMPKALRQVWLSASFVLFVAGLVPLTTHFFLSFRNQALAALALVALAPVLAGFAAFGGGAVAGLFELAIAHVRATHRERAARVVAAFVASGVGVLVAAAIASSRHRFPSHDGAALLLTGLWLAGTVRAGRWIAARPARFANLPRSFQFAAGLMLISCALATSQVVTRHAPSAVTAARPNLAVFRVVMPAAAERARVAARGKGDSPS